MQYLFRSRVFPWLATVIVAEIKLRRSESKQMNYHPSYPLHFAWPFLMRQSSKGHEIESEVGLPFLHVPPRFRSHVPWWPSSLRMTQMKPCLYLAFDFVTRSDLPHEYSCDSGMVHARSPIRTEMRPAAVDHKAQRSKQIPSKHAGSDPEAFWLRPVMAITASMQPE